MKNIKKSLTFVVFLSTIFIEQSCVYASEPAAVQAGVAQSAVNPPNPGQPPLGIREICQAYSMTLEPLLRSPSFEQHGSAAGMKESYPDAFVIPDKIPEAITLLISIDIGPSDENFYQARLTQIDQAKTWSDIGSYMAEIAGRGCFSSLQKTLRALGNTFKQDQLSKQNRAAITKGVVQRLQAPQGFTLLGLSVAASSVQNFCKDGVLTSNEFQCDQIQAFRDELKQFQHEIADKNNNLKFTSLGRLRYYFDKFKAKFTNDKSDGSEPVDLRYYDPESFKEILRLELVKGKDLNTKYMTLWRSLQP